jgi:ABC-type oligopeptide transport system substrate-binding subunit
MRASTQEDIESGSRALDRIFIAEHYAVPYLYYPNSFVAYWDRLGIPPILPKYYSIENGLAAIPWPISTWWAKNRN